MLPSNKQIRFEPVMTHPLGGRAALAGRDGRGARGCLPTAHIQWLYMGSAAPMLAACICHSCCLPLQPHSQRRRAPLAARHRLPGAAAQPQGCLHQQRACAQQQARPPHVLPGCWPCGRHQQQHRPHRWVQARHHASAVPAAPPHRHNCAPASPESRRWLGRLVAPRPADSAAQLTRSALLQAAPHTCRHKAEEGRATAHAGRSARGVG